MYNPSFVLASCRSNYDAALLQSVPGYEEDTYVYALQSYAYPTTTDATTRTTYEHVPLVWGYLLTIRLLQSSLWP